MNISNQTSKVTHHKIFIFILSLSRPACWFSPIIYTTFKYKITTFIFVYIEFRRIWTPIHIANSFFLFRLFEVFPFIRFNHIIAVISIDMNQFKYLTNQRQAAKQQQQQPKQIIDYYPSVYVRRLCHRIHSMHTLLLLLLLLLWMRLAKWADTIVHARDLHGLNWWHMSACPRQFTHKKRVNSIEKMLPSCGL